MVVKENVFIFLSPQRCLFSTIDNKAARAQSNNHYSKCTSYPERNGIKSNKDLAKSFPKHFAKQPVHFCKMGFKHHSHQQFTIESWREGPTRAPSLPPILNLTNNINVPVMGKVKIDLFSSSIYCEAKKNLPIITKSRQSGLILWLSSMVEKTL